MWKQVLTELLQYHQGKFFGILLGLTFGLLVILIGFLQTIFVAVCIYAGYIIGKRVDDNESIKEVMEHIFKEK